MNKTNDSDSKIDAQAHLEFNDNASNEIILSNSIKIIDTDIVVVGGGLSGVMAAIAAKRTSPNIDVWLIERYGFLGGMATAGYVFPFMRYYTRKKLLSGGLFFELIQKLHELGLTEGYKSSGFYQRFEPNLLRCVLDDFVKKENINVLFHAVVNEVGIMKKPNTKLIDEINRDDNDIIHISSIIAQTKAGKIIFHPKTVIDCSGDADIVFHAGLPWNMGRDSDGLTQPATLNFRMGNVIPLGTNRHTISKKIKKEKGNGNELTPRNDCLMFKTDKGGFLHEFHFNQTRVAGFDFTDPLEMSKAELEGRKQAFNFIRFLKKKVLGFKKSRVLSIGTQLGIRESRRIIGEYILTERDLFNCVQFPDRICLGNYSIDVHDPKGGPKTEIIHIPEGKFYSIPYRSLVPKNSENIIVAGRPISTTHKSHSAIRIMPICATMGQAAGVAAALKITKYSDLRMIELPIEEIQNGLRSQNAILE